MSFLKDIYKKINTLEEIEILKAASSKYLLNDVITGQNEPMYKIQNSTIEIISDLIPIVNCTSQETEEITRPVENVALPTEDLQERKHNL
jgi:hypothetical protein